ncbi:P-loop containing nucleoside triphosphate hydrolase protein, partial [Eremomyces bilateralis CBS 781.70]
METWVYPTNLGRIRDYQFNIVQKALFHNTLVALPTGLGKTFIAATIMLNWLRWTKNAQIVFVAPTKPLVAQQVEACFRIAGIPRSETTMLTGEVSPVLREAEWESKRVFFMTAQTLMNDLQKGTADPKRIVLLVVDEAHRATGAYSYVEVVKFIVRFNQSFRILALTATPGATVEAVQNVIDGLKISRIEIRTEDSIDIREYVHQRQMEKYLFDETEEMALLIGLYSKALRPLAEILKQQNAYWTTDPSKMTPYGLTQERSKWMATAGKNAPNWQKGLVGAVSAILGTFAFAFDMLLYHGITPFFQKLDQFRQEVQKDLRKVSKYKKQVYDNEHFNKMMNYLDTWTRNPNFIGHPKLECLQQRLMTHFLDNGEGSERTQTHGTKVMIFANWRSSAEDIVRILRKNSPIIRPHVFVGQAKSHDSDGMSQKTQQEVIDKFKSGEYNTLVATSIGEEGLDIGEVDLICCYDSKSSPVRMLQRMGRTGRKRAGRIILLMMKGKEEAQAEKAKVNYQDMQGVIASGSKFAFHDEMSRRILPKDMVPVVDKREVEIPVENSQADTQLPIPSTQGRKRQKRKPKKFHMPDGVQTGFVTANRLGDDEEERGAPVQDPPADIPTLDEVLLTRADEADFEHRYLNTAGDDNNVVSAPALDRFPDHQMKPSRGFLIPSRKDKRTLSGMMKRMHQMG